MVPSYKSSGTGADTSVLGKGGKQLPVLPLTLMHFPGTRDRSRHSVTFSCVQTSTRRRQQGQVTLRGTGAALALPARVTWKEGTWSQHSHKNWALLVLSGIKQHPSLLPPFLCVPPGLLRISITMDLHLQGVNNKQEQ